MICIYEANTTTWTGNGLCILQPSSCTVKEIAGGDFGLTLIHAEVILPCVSAFPAVVKFFAFDLLGRGGEGPDGALLIVQLLLRLLAELFTRDKFRHEVHILSSMAVG